MSKRRERLNFITFFFVIKKHQKRIPFMTFFTPGYKLSNHVISTHDVISPLECTEACLGTSGCKSYNYQEAGSPFRVCQLSNQSKSSAPSSDYVMQPGFAYYDAELYVCRIGCV